MLGIKRPADHQQLPECTKVQIAEQPTGGFSQLRSMAAAQRPDAPSSMATVDVAGKQLHVGTLQAEN